jgi:hypothetical protein
MSNPYHTRSQGIPPAQNPDRIQEIEDDDTYVDVDAPAHVSGVQEPNVDVGPPTGDLPFRGSSQGNSPAQQGNSSAQQSATVTREMGGSDDMEIDFENQSMEQLEAILAAKEAVTKKQEIIRKLRLLGNPRIAGEAVNQEILALKAIEARKLNPPRESTLIKTFHGRTTQEYDTFLNRLHTYFSLHPIWFAYSRHKVLAASQYLSDDRNNEWQAHEQKLAQPATWEDFREFCLHFVNDPESIYRDAVKDYHRSVQKPYQTVREFATQLDGIHRRLRYPYGEQHRREHLWVKVQEQVRSEALRYNENPDTYDGYIAHLCMVESQIPERKRAIKNDKTDSKNNAGPSSQLSNDNSSSQARSNPGPRAKGKVRRGRNHEGKDVGNKGEKRKRDESPDASSKSAHPDIECWKCHKKGHYASNCSSAPADQTPKAKNG